MKKDAYVKKANAQLAGWQADIDKLKAQADEAQADAQLAYYKDIEKLREQQDKAHKRLAEIEAASQNAWKDLKAGAETAWLELEKSIKSAVARFD